MPTVTVTLPHHRYEIVIEPGALSGLGERVRKIAPNPHAAIVADATVAKLHGETAVRSLSAAGYAVLELEMPVGEKNKNLDTVRTLYTKLAENRFERGSPIVALGGGVTGDTAGFVAATYLRGVPFVQCPTTLLAMVDSSIGGKVAVNLPEGKNLVGAFYQPNLVVIDTATLKTLPPSELRSGLAECVKHAIIADAALFAWIDSKLDAINQRQPEALVELVERNVRIKAEVVMADEKEQGRRSLLNLGHTFGHAIEATVGYGTYSHGEAISLGMVAAARLAASLGRCDRNLPEQVLALLSRIGLPVGKAALAPTATLMNSMQLDKKVLSGRLRVVLPDRIGAASLVSDAPSEAIEAAWESLR